MEKRLSLLPFAFIILSLAFPWPVEAQSYADSQVIVRLKNAPKLKNQTFTAQQFNQLDLSVSRALNSIGAQKIKPVFGSSFKPIVFRAGMTSAQVSRMSQLNQQQRRTVLVTLPNNVGVEDAIRTLQNDPNVDYAEPNHRIDWFLAPDDPLYNTMWGLENTGQSGSLDIYDPATGTLGDDVEAENAWAVQTGAGTTVVAVIDSGLDWDHPDIVGNVYSNSGETAGNSIDDDGNGYVDDVRGWDFGDSDADPDDDCSNSAVRGHGTHVSGTIGAVGNNATGVTGVNWSVSVLPIKVADSVCNIFTAALADAIRYAADQGAHVSNMSLGGSESSTLESAVDYADTQGLLQIAAAGNSATNDFTFSYPAAYNNVMAVAATDRNDQIASFSNYGDWITVSAPGVAIRSLIPVADGSYAYYSGTSMATPMTVGVAGLIKSQYPSLTAAQIQARLVASAEDVSNQNPNYTESMGSGRINAARALISVTSVSPANAINNGNTTLTITGVSFLSGMSVSLARSGETPVTASNVNFVSNSTLEATLDLSAITPGYWDIEVSIGQTIQSLSNAVLVQELNVETMTPYAAPNTGPPGTVTLVGSGFTSDVLVSLLNTGQPDIPGANVIFVSCTTATAEFNLTGAKPGRWDLAMHDEGVTLVFEKLFAVTSASFVVDEPLPSVDNTYSIAGPAGTFTVLWPSGTLSRTVVLDMNANPTFTPVDTSKDPYQATGIGMEIETSPSNIAMSRSMTLTMPYRLSDLPNPQQETALTIGTFNTTTQRWEPLLSTIDTVAKTVTASVSHLSEFAILQHTPTTNLDRVIAYPSPFRPSQGHTQISFDYLSAGARVRVYDVSGELVKDLSDGDDDGHIVWDATNEDGDPVASGIYFYLTTDSNGNKKTGRLGVIR